MDSAFKDSLVVGQNSQGLEVRGSPVQLSRFAVSFEMYGAATVLRLSEVLNEFRIIVQDRPLYSGRAVVRSLVNAGPTAVCEASLEEASWRDLEFGSAMMEPGKLREEFASFIAGWQQLYLVRPEYKAVMGDFQSFLTELRLWLEQVELGIRASPSPDRSVLERKVVREIAEPVTRSINSFVERFEAIATKLEPALQPVHRIYLRRQLHPLLLCSPFAYRAFAKPLGYAGDYELVDMMLREPCEGSSLFAKALNVWLLGQAPARGHRNRIDYLARKLLEETARVTAQGRRTRVYNLGCGPAVEIQRFLQEQSASNATEFTLLDFNEETLAHVRSILEGLKRTHGRNTSIRYVKRSVQQVLKDGGKYAPRPENQYDFVYCAGLFDYLADNVCKRLMNIFYDMLAPGGLLVATNVSDVMNEARPFRYSMEYMLDWHLIYRDAKRLEAAAPTAAAPEDVAVLTEDSGVNVFLEVRKPKHG
jgi:extracellular factor (EF) 3-hydroxypalmitic acid methyl ester biosynthesis protein